MNEEPTGGSKKILSQSEWKEICSAEQQSTIYIHIEQEKAFMLLLYI